jgi:hypothetical protein
VNRPPSPPLRLVEPDPAGPAERLADALGYIPTPEAIALVAGWDVDRVRWLLAAVEEGRT